MTEQEAQEALIEDIKATLRLNARNAEDPELAKAASTMLARVENNLPLVAPKSGE